MKPLSEKLRPTKLSNVVGQEHLVGKNGIIKKLVSSGQLISLIFWGPPGSGKTTLARIMANETGAELLELSAVATGKADVMRAIEHAKQNNRLQQKTLLFVDEIHRFNKAQQDAFLPYVEDGTIILIGATTENPSFEVINPLLSRSRVLVLKPLDHAHIAKVIMRGSKYLGMSAKRLPKKSIDLLAYLADGDARVALNNLEIASQLTNGVITPDIVQTAAQKRMPNYDKKGEGHYNIISAFIKSMRGNDANAALYYLARMLQTGEDPKFIARRLVIFASEDVGIAANGVLNLAVSTFQAVERIGMPECRYNLYHCAIVLAKCEKSRTVTNAMNKAEVTANEHPNLGVPLHLRNAPTKIMKDLGYQQGTKWEANFKHPKGFLPPEIDDLDVFA